MIDLVLSNGNVFVWSADDWLVLRKEYKIVGQSIGCLPKVARQEILHGPPHLLLNEEVTLLLDKKISRLIEYPHLHEKPNEDILAAYQKYREEIIKEQEECLIDERKKMIANQMDRIVEGKRRKLLGLTTSKKKMRKSLDASMSEEMKKIEIDREALMAEEIERIPKLDVSESLVQIHTAYPWANDDDIKEVEWKYPESPEDIFKYKVFKDLWEKGFFVTKGENFGGEFLAYPGDPIMFHSQFIVCCKNRDEEISTVELAGQCRVAGNVRKTQVFAYMNEDGENVSYQSFNWDDCN